MWSLTADRRLSAAAARLIETADSVRVSPISFFEIAQKVRLRKWPEMEAFVAQLPVLLAEQGGAIASLDPQICLSAGMMPWAHRDPLDRLLAATATHYNPDRVHRPGVRWSRDAALVNHPTTW